MQCDVRLQSSPKLRPLLSVIWALTAVAAVRAGPALAQGDPAKLCFPPHVGLPYTWQAPTVDGYVEPELGRSVTPPPAGQLALVETGWNRATRITYASGASVPLVTAQFLKHKTDDYIYLAFLVHYDPTFDDEDRIVLTFRPSYWQTPPSGTNPGVPITTKSTDERRVDIQPVWVGVGANQLGYNDPNDDNLATPGDPNTARLRTNRRPQSVTYYGWNGSSWSQLTQTPTGNGAGHVKQSEFTDNIKVRSWDAGTNNRNWFVEIRLPTTKAKGGDGWLDLSTSFGLYFNVLRVCNATACATPQEPSGGSNVQGFLTAEFTYPRANYANGQRLLNDPTGTLTLDQFPIPATWYGEAVLGGATSDCRGVRFLTQNTSIGTIANANDTTTPLSTTINALSNNIFAARVLNDGPSSAPNVNAEFRIAGWGSQNPSLGYWDLIPSTNAASPNPTAPANIASGAMQQFTTQWDPTVSAPPWFSQRAKHNCVAVRLSSTSDVYFSEQSDWNNLNFVPMSKHSEEAELKANGYAQAASGTPEQQFALVASQVTMTSSQRFVGWNNKLVPTEYGDPVRIRAVVAGAAQPAGAAAREQVNPPLPPLFGQVFEQWARADATTSTIVWAVNGYRKAPYSLKLGTHVYQLYEPTTSFGVVGTHVGEVDAMTGKLSGGNLVEVGDHVWQTRVKDGERTTFDVTVEAVEPKKWSVGLRAGVAIPHGNLANSYSTNLALTLDLEYRINSIFSVLVAGGRDAFSGKSGAADLTVWRVQALARAYKMIGPVRGFLQAGAGSYTFDPGSTYAGGSVGAGIQYAFTPTWAAELTYDAHAVNTSGSNSSWSDVQLGARFRY